MCCTLLGITELKKPPWTPCPHIREHECGSCLIYAVRPQTCKWFECGWKVNEAFGDYWKPLVSGMVVAEQDGDKIQIWVDPSNRNRWMEEPYRSEIANLVVNGIGRYTVEIRLSEPEETIAIVGGKRSAGDLMFLQKLPDHQSQDVARNIKRSKSQERQDIFALSQLEFLKNGFFVDIGAGNGLTHSNTYLLEKEYGWNGILAEPAKCWHKDLSANRKAHIETKCVWSKSSETVTFKETEKAELSTISRFINCDQHGALRADGKTYDVDTISLDDLLDKYEAPQIIDYLSIDTEGSEFEILSAFDFSRRGFRVITCEHNYSDARRQQVYDLLTSHGYERKWEDVSQVDDWYVKQ